MTQLQWTKTNGHPGCSHTTKSYCFKICIQHRRIWGLIYHGQIIALLNIFHTNFVGGIGQLDIFMFMFHFQAFHWRVFLWESGFSIKFSSTGIVMKTVVANIWEASSLIATLLSHFWHLTQISPLAHFISFLLLARHLMKNFLQLKKRQFDRCYDLHLLVGLIWSRLASKWHFTTCISYLDLVYKCRAEEWGYTRWGGFYRTQVSLGSDLWVRLSFTHWLSYLCADLTDVTLADEDTNSILTDNANRAIQGNVAMQVAPSGGQICN